MRLSASFLNLLPSWCFRALLTVLLLTLAGVGCSAPGEPLPGEPLGEVQHAVSAPLAGAYCSVTVSGKGVKAMEDDYLPRVITCENGGANLEALKAQAIAARSVAYYNMATSGSICDGQGCQVYSCGAAPTAKHYQAVKETAGMYLAYAGTLTYGFYVAGDSGAKAPSCKDYAGSTTKYVTYNEGKTGTAVTQTSLGWIGPPGNGQNRGCMGQWGARCLENQKGYDYKQILRFYYGADIQILKANGPCTQGCEPTHCSGSKIVSACGAGDCAAYGAKCVDDSKGVRCVSVFCPAQGTKKVCVNDDLIGDCKDGAISTGSCGAYGAKCVDDELGARCVNVFCPAKGKTKVCLDDSQIMDCDNGAPGGVGECGAYGAYCSTAGSTTARCVSAFCVSPPSRIGQPVDPNQPPGPAHATCLPDGKIAQCTSDGGLTDATACPAGTECVVSGGSASCAAPGSGSGGSGAGGNAGSGGDASGGAGTGGVGTGGNGTGGKPAKSQSTAVLAGDDGGCSMAPVSRGASGWPALLLLGAVSLWVRRRAAFTALAALPIALASFGCSAPVPVDESEHESCEPPVATVSEALSSIDCTQSQDTGYKSGSAFAITVVTVDGKKVEKDTANAYYVMAQAAAKAGVTLKVVSGFRTMSEQQYLYSCYVNCNCNNCNLAAKPGYSNHQSGHALDLNTSSPGVYSWLEKNAAAFGFKRTVPSEAWHWEWWGGGPGGGPCGCQPTHCSGSKIVSACGAGDCAAYGATCVNDSLGVRCVSVFCPAKGTKKVCVNDDLIGDCNNGGISTGSCGAYGAKCVDDELGARCVSVFCPAKGKTQVCLDDSKIMDCDNGAPGGVGECGAYGAYCSTAGASSARCVSAFCVSDPKQPPGPAHATCLPDGRIAQCTSDGGLTDAKDCPAGSACVVSGGSASCVAPGGGGGGAGSGGAPGGGGSAGAGSGGSSGGWGTGGSSTIEPEAPPTKNARPSGDDVEGGCACRAGGVPRPLGAWWLAGVALAVAAWRRRHPR